MAGDAEQKENPADSPSMEDILKSIRGVISGEDAESAEDDMLELTEMEIAEEEVPLAAADGTTTAGLGDLAEATTTSEMDEKSVLDNIDEALSETAPEEIEVKPAEVEDAIKPEEAKTEDVQDILEATTDGATGGNGLDNTAVQEEKEKDSKNSDRLLKEKVADESSETLRSLVSNIPRTHVASPYTRGGTTLEEPTIEAMKPFLAEWLNENLPTIVKQIVSKEIKKLIPQEDDK